MLADTGPAGRAGDRGRRPLAGTALSAWLDRLASGGRITLLRNRRNLGFVASVNRGMEAAGTHDVALLNSDTEVPPGWLRGLRRRPMRRRASPPSRRSPTTRRSAAIPATTAGRCHSARTWHDRCVCREVNAGRSVAVPTTVGFCMYIRRAALDEVGGFDAEAFGRGYGEENDFCLRAARAAGPIGWPATRSSYHEGSVSFGAGATTGRQQAMDTAVPALSGLRAAGRAACEATMRPGRFGSR